MSGKETIFLVDLTQPQCVNTYGVAPCTAVLGTTGTRKCCNTRFTCQDSPHYSATPLTTRFTLPNDGLFGYGPVIPALLDIPQFTPGAVNIGGADQNMGALGSREQVTLKLTDLQHSDLGFDKYRLERYTGAAQSDGIGYDPYWRGTLWGKWLARNPYYISYPAYSLTVYRGYVGDDISTFLKRTYIIDSIENQDGAVSMVGKDLFTKLDDKKAVAPAPSPGSLSADITDVQTTAVLTPTGIGDTSYPASGYGRIGDECVSFTRSGDNLTIVRALLGTTKDTHNHDDTFQLVLAYVAQTPQAISADLLTNYTEIPSSSVSLADWNTAAANAGIFNQYTTYITEPTPVLDLLGELSIQAGFTLFPDTSTNSIRFLPLTAGTSQFTVVDDWIIDKTLKTTHDDTKRASQVWVYYGMKDFTKSIDEETNYATRVLSIDLASEAPEEYGTPSVRKEFSRWIPQFGRASAQNTADRLVSMFRDPPMEATYEVHKDRTSSFTPAGMHSLKTDLIQDDDGSTLIAQHATISVSPKENTTEVNTMAVSFVPVNSNRDIYIDVDTPDVVVRSAYDLLYSAPVGTEAIRVFVNAHAYASTVGGYGLDTGVFPAGCSIEIIYSSSGNTDGAGGKGGKGGNAFASDSFDPTPTAANGSNGLTGGIALKVRQATTLSGSGFINGGGGGAGGGGGVAGAGAVGGTGGGAGRGVGPGGDGGVATGDPFFDGGRSSVQQGFTGNAGTISAPGAALAGNNAPNPPRIFGGSGGLGGDWGQPGNSGGVGIAGFANGVGGTGGAAGAAVEGNAFITWAVGNTITVRGALT